ncbi:MAG: hypothetical protein Q9180_005117 [Flavoplaca navasiana]
MAIPSRKYDYTKDLLGTFKKPKLPATFKNHQYHREIVRMTEEGQRQYNRLNDYKAAYTKLTKRKQAKLQEKYKGNPLWDGYRLQKCKECRRWHDKCTYPTDGTPCGPCARRGRACIFPMLEVLKRNALKRGKDAAKLKGPGRQPSLSGQSDLNQQSESEDQGKHQDKPYDQLKKEGKRKTWGPPRQAKIAAEGKRPIDEVDTDLEEGNVTRKKVKTSTDSPRRQNDEKAIPATGATLESI